MAAKQLEAVGYWFNELAPNRYPRPQALVGRWRADRRAAVVAYLRAGAVFESYRGGSYCRFDCGVSARELGRTDRFDGAWVWPEGLAHYVEVHAVRLPERFVRRAARGRPAAPPLVRPTHRDGLIAEASWLAWGRAQGAAVELAPWAIPDWATRHQLEQRCQAQVGPGHVLWRQRPAVVLWRADTGAVVCALRSGQLAIVALGRRGSRSTTPPTQVLAGWHEWARRGR